jgi:hypothetical protein
VRSQRRAGVDAVTESCSCDHSDSVGKMGCRGAKRGGCRGPTGFVSGSWGGLLATHKQDYLDLCPLPPSKLQSTSARHPLLISSETTFWLHIQMSLFNLNIYI